MSECIPTAPNNKGAIQYTHLFLCISSGRRLTNFSMRSLYFQIHLHPSLCPLISHSVWCHRPDVHFNAAFFVELSKLEPLTINDLSISFDLYSRQLQSSSHLGTAKLALNQKETLQKGKKPITYFYHQDPVDLIDPYTPTPVGNIFVTIALGYEEQLNLIEPQTRFIQVQITPIDKKNTRYSSPSNWMKTAHKHGWMSLEEIEDNWMQIAQSNGWIPYQKSDNLTLETFHQVDILKEYEVQPTADLLTIQPESDSNSLFQEPPIVTHEFIPPEEIAQIFPQPKTKFNNKIKKPITVMDFFPRLSYSNKYDNSEKSDSEWDILIGKYLKKSSSTLKSFPKQKRTKSAAFDRPPFLNSSFNQFQKAKSKNIERSSSQYLNIQKVNNSNSISQSESSELDSSNNNFLTMLNNDENSNKNNQNKLRKSKNSKQNKKYDLDDDEKEWSSDFFSDSLDTTSKIELESDLNNQKNKKDTNTSINISLEEIVEKEMKKLAENSKKPPRKNNYQNTINKEDLNISNTQLQPDSIIDDSKKSKTVLFSPPPSLTQVIQNADKNNEKCDQQNEIDSSNSQMENLNNPEEEINDNYININIENNVDNEDSVIDKNFQQSKNYSILDDQQIQTQQAKKIRKRKHRTKNIQQTTDFNQENDQLQVVQSNEYENKNFVNDSKNEIHSDFPEKITIKRRKLRSKSPTRRQRELKNKDQQIENQNQEEPFSPYYYNQNQTNFEKSPDQFENENTESSETFQVSPLQNENIKSNHDDIESFKSPPSQSIQFNDQEAPFSVPMHRKRHSENDPIRPYEPQLQDEVEQFNEYSQKANASQIDLQKSHIRKTKSDRYKEQIQHKKKYHQELNQETQTIENEGELNSFKIKQKDSLQQNEEDEEDQPTSPKIQFDEEGNIETPLSTPRHKHKHKKQEENDEIQLKYYNEEKEKNDQSANDYIQQEETQLFFNEQQNQQIPKSLTKRKRSNQQRKKTNNEEEAKNIFQEPDFNQFLNDHAASSSAPSSNSPSQSSQGQQLTVSSSTNPQQKNQNKTSPESEQEKLSTEKVIYNTKRKQLSPTLLLENQQQKQSKFQRLQKLSPSDDNSKIITRTTKSSRMKYLPAPNEILNNRESTIPEKISPDYNKASNIKSRSFISTSQSMIDSKQSSSATKNSPKRKVNRNSKSFYNTENSASSLLSKTGPVSITPYKQSSSFIESISTESSFKKRKKRQNMTLSNSPKNLPKEDNFLGSDEISNNNNLSKTFVVHSPTKMNQKAKLEIDYSTQMIDFSSTSPVMLSTKSSYKKRTPNSPLKNLNDNQNLNRNEIKNEEEVVNSLKKSRTVPKYYKNSPDSQENDENITSDIKFKKSGGLKKSPVKREKKTPKKPMDIKTTHSFTGPGPLSPATPNAQKKGIRMSPSLERMINGIDKLENFDISGIEYDSDN